MVSVDSGARENRRTQKGQGDARHQDTHSTPYAAVHEV